MQQIEELKDDDIETMRKKLLGSLLLFTTAFFQIRTGKKFVHTTPLSREPYERTLCKEFTKVFRGETQFLLIRLPPRYGKTEIAIHFIAWALAHYPDCQFIYTSYGASVATEQTSVIRQIISLPSYQELFGVRMRSDSTAKDHFKTTNDGVVYAVGSGGAVTSFGAGLSNIERFGGCIVADDLHKADEAFSDTIREQVNRWFRNTLKSRLNNPFKTPIIVIGQTLHEHDLGQVLAAGEDGEHWRVIDLPARGANGQPLRPDKHDIAALDKLEKFSPYEYWSQYQQKPRPAGGGLYKSKDFVILKNDPQMVSTFIVVDSAETDKTFNDATVFSFFGLYKIETNGVLTDQFALHWLDCVEIWVEPKDLKGAFLQFYAHSMSYKVKPKIVAIEKKSTGVTLISILKELRGINIREIQRGKKSKMQRFIDAQPWIAQKLVSFTFGMSHVELCIEHMASITGNNTHRRDDIADTCTDAIEIALVDKTLSCVYSDQTDNVQISSAIFAANKKLSKGLTSWRNQ